jgi:hypothetical protein
MADKTPIKPVKPAPSPQEELEKKRPPFGDSRPSEFRKGGAVKRKAKRR